MISEMSRPARQARAKPPPFTRLSVRRTVLSCSMFAPAALSARVTRILSSSEIPGAGAGRRAEPPPEIRQKQRSSGPSEETILRISFGADDAFGSWFVDAGGTSRVKMNSVGGHDAIGGHVDPTA